MSPTVIVCLCAYAVACAALAFAAPTHDSLPTDLHLEDQEAVIKSTSAQKQFMTPEIDESKRILHGSGPLETVTIPASDLDREVTSYHKIKRRIRRNIMSNGKCAQGYIKIGNTCMDCKELDSCD